MFHWRKNRFIWFLDLVQIQWFELFRRTFMQFKWLTEMQKGVWSQKKRHLCQNRQKNYPQNAPVTLFTEVKGAEMLSFIFRVPPLLSQNTLVCFSCNCFGGIKKIKDRCSFISFFWTSKMQFWSSLTPGFVANSSGFSCLFMTLFFFSFLQESLPLSCRPLLVRYC